LSGSDFDPSNVRGVRRFAFDAVNIQIHVDRHFFLENKLDQASIVSWLGGVNVGSRQKT
jgi:hypothetical protein